MTESIQKARESFSKMLANTFNLTNQHLISAFSRVPREEFAPPKPWHLRFAEEVPIETEDPRKLYTNSLLQLDPEKGINNGEPGIISIGFNALELSRGNTVVQIGTGYGYYTAILSETVGPSGKVIAIEIDPDQYEHSKRNLKDFANVQLIQGDGSSFDPGPVDAVFSHAGASYPQEIWIRSLNPQGVLVFPLTFLDEGTGTPSLGKMVKIKKAEHVFETTIICSCGFYPCIGGRDEKWDLDLKRLSRNYSDKALCSKLSQWSSSIGA